MGSSHISFAGRLTPYIGPKDYMAIPEEALGGIKPLMTMVDGRIVFVHNDFSAEYNLRPEGAVISTYEDLTERRGGASARSGEGLR